MAQLFGYVIRQTDRQVKEVEKDVRAAWGKRLSHLQPTRIEELRERMAAASSPDAADRSFGWRQAFTTEAAWDQSSASTVVLM